MLSSTMRTSLDLNRYLMVLILVYSFLGYLEVIASDDATPISTEDSCWIKTGCNICLGSTPTGDFECAWCKDKCIKRVNSSDVCSKKRFKCPVELLDFNPNLTFEPSRGPREGGTDITIYRKLYESVINVTVAGVLCDVKTIGEDKIVCTTQEGLSGSHDIVKVYYDKDIEGTNSSRVGLDHSKVVFNYVNPHWSNFRPLYGPECGGTTLTIDGKNLFIGTTRTILVNGLSCLDTSNQYQFRGYNILKCATSAAKNVTTNFTTVEIFIDRATVKPPKVLPLFEYRPDPEAYNFLPKATILSGGTVHTVTGRNLNSVANPTLTLKYNSNSTRVQMEYSAFHISTAEDGRSMVVFVKVPPQSKMTLPFNATVKVNLDGCSVDLEQSMPFYLDPHFNSFNNSLQLVNSDSPFIELSTTHLRSDYEVTVLVGQRHKCKVGLQTDQDTLRCKLDIDGFGQLFEGQKYNVTVKVGALLFQVGDIEFAGSRVMDPDDVKKVVQKDFSDKYMLIIVFTGVFVLAIVAIGYVLRRTMFQKSKNGSKNGTSLALDMSGDFRIEKKMMRSKKKLIGRDLISLGNELGSGNFGVVYSAQLELPGNRYERVAVKTTKKSVPGHREKALFAKEALIMKDFDHQNVLNLIGVSFDDDGSPLIVLPFMTNQSLLHYLKEANHKIILKQLIAFGLEIAKGMEYLAGQECVHRDLAARNCLLDENLCVKVSDFGLARELFQKYYRIKSNNPLPSLWMAPESLKNITYSSMSDVWSFGVTLWEVMTRGDLPYGGGIYDSHALLLSHLETGHRLAKPENCPDALYDVMSRCWSMEPHERPTFTEIVQEMELLQE